MIRLDALLVSQQNNTFMILDLKISLILSNEIANYVQAEWILRLFLVSNVHIF